MSRDIRTPEDVFSWAEGFTNLEKGGIPFDKRNYRLDRMGVFLSRLGNPDQAYRSIHIAGTKGKGSTAVFIASVLQAAGENAGLYTSPHVMTPLERISVNGAPPEPELFLRVGRGLRREIERMGENDLPGGFHPTTFELYTLLAFLTFRAAGCSEAVVETGIGGRLDATNVLRPRGSVITPLDLEHTEILGDTIARIAFEKAGIVKEGTPAFVGVQPPEAKEIFRKAGEERNAPLFFLDEELELLQPTLSRKGTVFRIKLRGMEPDEFRLSLLGAFQAENAALAYLALRRLRPEIPRDAFVQGFLNASLPGRMEVASESPPIVVDGAHTPLAVKRLLESFSAVFPGNAILIFGSVSGKKPREMAEVLAPAFEKVIISTPGTFKESNPEELFGIFRAINPRTVLEKDPAAALRMAEEDSGGTLPILVTGSFYMIAEIGKLLARRKN
jgi:dihydrofolate synthase/folylpolyglutamate synthase